MTEHPEIRGMRVAAIVADGFEQAELDGPVKALRDAGVQVDVLGPTGHPPHIKGVNHFEPGTGVEATTAIDQADPGRYDALLVPGGLASPDTMRQSEAHLRLVKTFMQAGKPTFAICHGPWLLADADVVQGRTLTTWPGIRRDLERAGAKWVDREVVRDGNLVTSRKPDDIPAFNETLLGVLAERAGERPSGLPTGTPGGMARER